MLQSNAPAKVPQPFAGTGTTRLPAANSAGVTSPEQPSWDIGWPVITETAKAVGGIPPARKDFNGVLNFVSSALQYLQAGGSYKRDATFSAAIGGYPIGAVVLPATGQGKWISTVDNNTTNPDAGGAGWVYDNLAQDLPSTASGKGADLVGYSTAGAIGRTVASKLGEVISVLDFGAYRDGTNAALTTSAINAAIAYAKANSNVHCIEFPTGNYAINGPISVKGNFGNGLNIKGNKSTITASHDGVVFDCDAALPSPAPSYRIHLNISDFSIVGPGKTNLNSVGVKMYGADYSMNHVYITGFYKAIDGSGCLISEFIECGFHNSQIGIWFDFLGFFAPNDVHFFKCNLTANVQAVKFMNFDYGAITMIGCEIEGNNISGNSTDGVKVCEFSGSPNGAGEVTLIGTHFEANPGQYNIYYDSPAIRHLNVIGCKMIPGDTTGSCIYIDRGELFVSGSHIVQNVGGNIVLTANTNSAFVVGDTSGLITGTLTKLVRIKNGIVNTGGKIGGASAAGIEAKGRLGVGINVEGSQYFTDATGARLGFISATGVALDAAAQYTITSGNGQLIFFRTGKVLEPAADNQYTLGSGALRWSTVYAATGAINTSDERAKQDIEEIPQEWLDAWGDVKYVRFKFRDSAQEKGDGARWHVGLIAQRVKDAFEARGIDPFAISILCHDKWDDVYVDEDVIDENGLHVLDENGSPLKRKKLVKRAGDQYGIRYEEALALECAYLRSRLAKA